VQYSGCSDLPVPPVALAELLFNYIITNRRFGNMIIWQRRLPLKNSSIFDLFLLAFLAFCTTQFSCNSRAKASYPSPPGYNLNKPIVYTLPDILKEISGIIYYKKDSSLFAINDEKGWLFKIHLGLPVRVERWKFSNAGDYEDLALKDSTFYVLKSKGVIEKFRFTSGDSLVLQSFKVPEIGNEFETLYFDSTEKRLILICKNCVGDKKKQVSSWSFDPVTDSFAKSFTIETSKIKEQLNDDELKFKPSAAAYHPITGELYIIASVNSALVILNKDHTVKGSYRIDPALFKQPEGMTFTPKGDLIISNEASERGAADILFFKYAKISKP